MELENQGGMGTELNHWEKRLLEVSLFENVTRPIFFKKIDRYTNIVFFFNSLRQIH